MDTKLKQYTAKTNHPKWRFQGKDIDLREVSDRDAAKLVKAGFKQLEKTPSSTGKSGNNNKDRGESRS